MTPDLLQGLKEGTETTGRVTPDPLKAHLQMMAMKGIIEDEIASVTRERRQTPTVRTTMEMMNFTRQTGRFCPT